MRIAAKVAVFAFGLALMARTMVLCLKTKEHRLSVMAMAFSSALLVVGASFL